MHITNTEPVAPLHSRGDPRLVAERPRDEVSARKERRGPFLQILDIRLDLLLRLVLVDTLLHRHLHLVAVEGRVRHAQLVPHDVLVEPPEGLDLHRRFERAFSARG
eukprot:GHVR01026525.1.p1 GENE.GHVR01026525.1~~GHVR01026525.1.p1  ORF type:complete len:106 (+),score=10.78 GHVR01026525.1:98-415(+)